MVRFSAFSTNKKSVEDGKLIIGDIIHDLVVGIPHNDDSTLGKLCGSIRLLNAQVNAHNAMKTVVTQHGGIFVHNFLYIYV
jgi:hypothetical protein